jgi:hypothetical protein
MRKLDRKRPSLLKVVATFPRTTVSPTSTAKMPTVKPWVPDTPSVREAAAVVADGTAAGAVAVAADTVVAADADAVHAAAEIVAEIVVHAAVEIAAGTTKLNQEIGRRLTQRNAD